VHSSSSKTQYLLLHSIREIIIDAPSESLAPHLDVIMALLFDNSSSPDDGTRNVVAECLGKVSECLLVCVCVLCGVCVCVCGVCACVLLLSG
jgi:hypothetical protein